MKDIDGRQSVWSLVKPLAGFLALGIAVVAGIGLFMGIAGAIISFAAGAAIRLLPILAVGALGYWIAREAGWIAKSRR